MRVLIVDDDSMVCRGLCKVVPWEELDCEIIGSVHNGEEALAVALREHPDLVITDVKMPVMDGLELSKKLKEVLFDVSIIIMSAYEDFEYACTAMRFGVRSYIVKPISEDKIQNLINEIRDIKKETEQKKQHYSVLYDKELDRDIIEALSAGDCEYITEFFNNKLPELCHANVTVQELCIKLVNLLYGQLEIKSSSNAESKDEKIDDIINIRIADDIIQYTYQLYLDFIQVSMRKRDSHKDAIGNFIQQYVDIRYSSSELSLTSLADELHVAPTYVSMIFKEYTGINLSRYITHLRMDAACELLQNPAVKLYDISEKVGYTDVKYFGRVFKKQMHVTPSEYRNLHMRQPSGNGGTGHVQ